MQHDRTDLDRHRDAVMKPCPTNRHGIRLRKRFAKIRNNLFVFVTEREVGWPAFMASPRRAAFMSRWWWAAGEPLSSAPSFDG